MCKSKQKIEQKREGLGRLFSEPSPEPPVPPFRATPSCNFRATNPCDAELFGLAVESCRGTLRSVSCAFSLSEVLQQRIIPF